MMPLPTLDLRVEFDREVDGRHIADIPDLPGVMAYGKTKAQALRSVVALAYRVIAERIEHGEAIPAKRSVRRKKAVAGSTGVVFHETRAR